MSPPLQTQKVICIIRCHGKDISLEDEDDDNHYNATLQKRDV